MQKTVRAIALASLLVGAIAGPANAARIRVSQESAPGRGDFDSVNSFFIDLFATTGTTTDFYSYGQGAASSYNGPIDLASSTANLFFVDGEDGLSFFNVYGNLRPGPNKGVARMEFQLFGDTANFLVEDDPIRGGLKSPDTG